MNKREIGQRQVCPLCQEKGHTPERGHVPAMKTNADGTMFCFRCGVEFGAGTWRIPITRRFANGGVVSSAQAREKAMFSAGIRPLPTEPETRFQAECLSYLSRRGVNAGQVRAWRVHYAVTGPYASRVVFPCFGPGGLEFFVARSIYSHLEPKMLHPAKGGVWPGKSEVVWGLNHIGTHTQEIVVCEGVFDAAVVPNGVAIFGKFLSRRQMTMVALRTQRLAIMLDGDARQEATQMKQKVQREFPRMRVRIIELPADMDPSDLGADEVHKILA